VKEGMDEKRKSRRSRVDISVVCSRVTGDPHGGVYSGRIESYSRDGLCVLVPRDFAVGTVLSVRAARRPGDGAVPMEIACLAVAEVRWSQHRIAPPEACYRIGLKYLAL
jgi:hypothetical protein